MYVINFCILTVIINDLHNSRVTNTDQIIIRAKLNGEISDYPLFYDTIVYYGDIQTELLIQAREMQLLINDWSIVVSGCSESPRFNYNDKNIPLSKQIQHNTTLMPSPNTHPKINLYHRVLLVHPAERFKA